MLKRCSFFGIVADWSFEDLALLDEETVAALALADGRVVRVGHVAEAVTQQEVVLVKENGFIQCVSPN